MALSQVYVKLSQHTNALAVLESYVTKHPHSIDLHASIARVHEQQQDFEASNAIYKKVTLNFKCEFTVNGRC